MTKPRDPDALLSAYLAAGMEVLPDRVVDSVLDEVHRTRQRVVFGPWRTRLMSRATLAAALVVAAVALGGAFFVFQRDQRAVVGPQPTATPSPFPSRPAAVVAPSATSSAAPTATPGPTPGPVPWTRASMNEDWPAPVRAEPAGDATVQPMPPTYVDPSGDTGSDAYPWVDIHRVLGGTSPANFNGSIVRLKVVSNTPPDVDPTEQWIAYGVVTDDDRDGVPDWRYGMDNVPDGASRRGHGQRDWRTNLHTGVTESTAGPKNWPPLVDAFYPRGDNVAFFWFSGEVTGGGTGGMELDMPFYAWASVIHDGRVVATDYAPDSGWLQASRGALPGGTYLLEDPFPVRLSMSVADGWAVNGGSLTRNFGGSRTTGLSFVIVDNPAKDACNSQGIDPPLGPSVDDLVTFLMGLPSIDIAENTDATLDGYRGRYLAYTKVAKGLTCSGPGSEAWPTNSQDGRDEHHQVWILDVDGVRLVIDAFSNWAASETDLAELRQIVDSIQIEP